MKPKNDDLKKKKCFFFHPFHSARRPRSQCDQIWRNFKHLWIIFNGLISIWQIYEPTLAILYALGQFFISSHCLKRTHPLMNLIDFKKEFQAILQTTIRISRQPIESAILSTAFSLIIH